MTHQCERQIGAAGLASAPCRLIPPLDLSLELGPGVDLAVNDEAGHSGADAQVSDNDRMPGWSRQNDRSHLPLNHNTARATGASDESGLIGDRNICRITADIIQHQQNRLSDCAEALRKVVSPGRQSTSYRCRYSMHLITQREPKLDSDSGNPGKRGT